MGQSYYKELHLLFYLLEFEESCPDTSISAFRINRQLRQMEVSIKLRMEAIVACIEGLQPKPFKYQMEDLYNF